MTEKEMKVAEGLKEAAKIALTIVRSLPKTKQNEWCMDQVLVLWRKLGKLEEVQRREA